VLRRVLSRDHLEDLLRGDGGNDALDRVEVHGLLPEAREALEAGRQLLGDRVRVLLQAFLLGDELAHGQDRIARVEQLSHEAEQSRLGRALDLSPLPRDRLGRIEELADVSTERFRAEAFTHLTF